MSPWSQLVLQPASASERESERDNTSSSVMHPPTQLHIPTPTCATVARLSLAACSAGRTTVCIAARSDPSSSRATKACSCRRPQACVECTVCTRTIATLHSIPQLSGLQSPAAPLAQIEHGWQPIALLGPPPARAPLHEALPSLDPACCTPMTL